MKKTRLFFALAIVLAMASAFASPAPKTAQKTNIYVARYDGLGNFSWELAESPIGECLENDAHNCKVEAISKPADNTTPSGTELGDYQF